MTILFTGTVMQDYDASSNAANFASDASAYLDSNYARTTVSLDTSTGYAEKGFTAVDAVWISATVGMYHTSYAAGRVMAALYAGTQAVVRLAVSGSALFRVERWTGTAWEIVIPDFSASMRRSRLALHARAGTTGEVRCYIDEVLVGTFSGDTSALAGMDRLWLSNATTTGSWTTMWSEVLIATHPVVTARVKTQTPSAAGTYAEMAGVVGNINTAVADDATALVSDVAGQRATFTMNALPANALIPTLLKYSVRAKRGSTGPLNLDALLRSGTADHAIALAQFDDAAFGYRVVNLTTNPVTGAAWTRDEVDALQVGVQSRA